MQQFGELDPKGLNLLWARFNGRKFHEAVQYRTLIINTINTFNIKLR